MEKNIKDYVAQEFMKLNTDTEQREFIETLRFLMMAGNREFMNYYSKSGVRKADFYAVVDQLYQLNNLWMLSEFIYQNRQVLLNEVSEIAGECGRTDFLTLCNVGKDTMVSRMLQVMTGFAICEGEAAADKTEYEK